MDMLVVGLVSFMAGGRFGMIALALCVAAKDGDL